MSSPWWTVRDGRSDKADLYAEEKRYREETGDRHYFVGYDRRFAEWLEKQKELVATRD